MRAVGTSSCKRLRARRKVDLPHPLGPIIAVTARAGISNETRLSTWLLPKYTESSRTVKATAVDPGGGKAWGTTGLVSCSFVSITMGNSLVESVPCQNPNGNVDQGNKQQQHQGPRPGLAYPVFVRRGRIVENLQ